MLKETWCEQWYVTKGGYAVLVDREGISEERRTGDYCRSEEEYVGNLIS